MQAIDAQIATVMTQTKTIANKLLQDLKQGKQKVTQGEKAELTSYSYQVEYLIELKDLSETSSNFKVMTQDELHGKIDYLEEQ